MVVLIWVGSAELIQIIFTSSGTEFDQPLFLTYFSTSFFTIYLIPLLYEFAKLKCRSKTPETKDISESDFID